MARTKLFLNNRTQAVRLPKEVAFPEGVKEVEIIPDGPRRILVPAELSWESFFDEPGIDIEEPPDLPPEPREPFE